MNIPVYLESHECSMCEKEIFSEVWDKYIKSTCSHKCSMIEFVSVQPMKQPR